jgi:BirA family biotin operon repressor/biotin-[acetyl-CoA-carboxylase] ligase
MEADEVIVGRLRGGAWVSGEELARELGLSRAAVGKRVGSLRERGFDIEARARRGYRLRALPDSLEPAMLAPLLQTKWVARKLEWHERCGSTNDLAAERARAGAPHGLCVVAEAQERGRGRMGRQWFSPPRKNIYLSLVVRPPLAPMALPPLALAVGLAAHETLHALGVAVDLKWPNDVLLSGKKLGGILIEMASELSRVSFAVIGVGINVNLAAADIPAALLPIATSMAIESGRTFDRAEVAARLLGAIERRYEEFEQHGPAPAARAFREAARATLGRRVRVAADRELEGIAETIGDDGRLILRDDSGQAHSIVAGEVLL